MDQRYFSADKILSYKAKAASIESFDFLRAGNIKAVSGMRLETARQGAYLVLPQP